MKAFVHGAEIHEVFMPYVVLSRRKPDVNVLKGELEQWKGLSFGAVTELHNDATPFFIRRDLNDFAMPESC